MNAGWRTAGGGSDSIAPGRCGFRFDGRALPGLSRRHAGLGTARQRRAPHRAVVQVSPSARHHGGGPRGSERVRHAVARRRPLHAQPPSATQVELYEGLVAESQNRWPHAALRRRAGQRLLVSFYSRRLLLQDLHVAAPSVASLVRAAHPRRRRTGAARRRKPIPDRYAKRYAHCEVLIVGAGPAGLAPRQWLRARSGARVLLCDEQA